MAFKKGDIVRILKSYRRGMVEFSNLGVIKQLDKYTCNVLDEEDLYYGEEDTWCIGKEDLELVDKFEALRFRMKYDL